MFYIHLSCVGNIVVHQIYMALQNGKCHECVGVA